MLERRTVHSAQHFAAAAHGGSLAMTPVPSGSVCCDATACDVTRSGCGQLRVPGGVPVRPVGDGVVDDDMNSPPRRGEGSPAPVAGPGAPRTEVIRRLLVRGTLAALLIGTAVAVGGAWVADLDGGDAETPNQGLAPPASSPAPAKPSARAVDCNLPLPSGYDRIDSLRSPEIIDIAAIDRTTVRLRWVDRSPATARFIVSRVCENGRTMKSRLVPQSDTEYIFSGLDPATAPYCFKVEALSTENDWESERRCISPPG
jgi:hypothetical protein